MHAESSKADVLLTLIVAHLPRIPASAAVRADVERDLRRLLDQATPRPRVVLSPELDGRWLIGAATTARLCTPPSRGYSGLAMIVSALRREQPQDGKTAIERRKAITRARTWIATQTDCRELIGALHSIVVTKRGVFCRPHAAVVDTGSRVLLASFYVTPGHRTPTMPAIASDAESQAGHPP